MKIFGVGIDIVKNSRIQNILQKTTSDRFLQKALHEKEIEKLKTISVEKKYIEYVASRWAVKESLVKALKRKDLDFASVWIQNDENGAPSLFLEEKVERIFKESKIIQNFISLSHEEDYSAAVVILMTI